MKKLVERLIECNKTISTMESCTGGAVASAITNIEGSSAVIKYSAITYSNEYKIKMGVSENTINKYSVYSIEVAREMSKSISYFSNSDYGIGVTGQINRVDSNNITGESNKIYISIYDRNLDCYYEKILTALKDNRINNKEYIIYEINKMMMNLLNEVCYNESRGVLCIRAKKNF